jgi:hypothetical protein
MWVEGTANGTYLRRSLKTASWERATELSRIIEESDKPAETPERKDAPVTIVQLIDATYLYRENRGETIGGNNGTRIRALIMLMPWSGLRIRDAVTLERTRLINDNLLLYPSEDRHAGLRAPASSSSRGASHRS